MVAAAILLLAGCGDDDPDPGGPTIPSPSVSKPVVVSGTNAGGEAGSQVTRLPERKDLEEYAAQFRGSLPDDLLKAAQSFDVADGQVLGAQVISVGCDVPHAASLQGDALVPMDVSPAPEECVAPVTSVALASVPATVEEEATEQTNPAE